MRWFRWHSGKMKSVYIKRVVHPWNTPQPREQLSVPAFNNMVIVLSIKVLLRIWHPCYVLIEPHIIFWHIFYEIMTAINLITIIFPVISVLTRLCVCVCVCGAWAIGHLSWLCCQSRKRLLGAFGAWPVWGGEAAVGRVEGGVQGRLWWGGVAEVANRTKVVLRAPSSCCTLLFTEVMPLLGEPFIDVWDLLSTLKCPHFMGKLYNRKLCSKSTLLMCHFSRNEQLTYLQKKKKSAKEIH